MPKLFYDLLLALAFAAGAAAVQWGLVPWMGPRLPAFMVYGPAVVFAAATLGRWPATLVMLIGAVDTTLALAPPGRWWPSDPGDLLGIAAYMVIGVLLITFGGRLHLRNSRAERAEQRLSLAQDETGVGLFELDYRAGTAYASPALCKILGQPVMHGSMPLEDWLQALNAGHVADSRRTLQAKVAAGELRYERELRVELPDGQQHWLLSRIRLDLDERGELAAARGATLDISARKQLVTELEAMQTQLQQQLDDLGLLHQLGNRVLAMPFLDQGLQAILDAVCSFHATPFGILWLYEADGRSRVAAHCGLGSDAITQMAAPGPSGAGAAVCGLAATSGSRVVVEDIGLDESVAALRPLAQALGVRALHITPLLAGGKGHSLGVLAVLSAAPGPPDERRRRLTDLCAGQAAALIGREQALSLARETQQRFEVALQSSSVAFTILAPLRDANGRVVDFTWTYANPAAAALIDRPVKELLGRPILEVLPHAWDEPGFFDRYVQVSEQGCTAEFDTLIRRPGRERWLHVIASPLNDSVVLWFADITQRREEQQALKDADRRKDEFLATLAHELRNPLAPIRNAVSLLNMPGAQVHAERAREILDRQVNHMVRLVDDLMEASRISRGKLELKRNVLDLADVLRAAVEISRPLIDRGRHDLRILLPAEPLHIDGDPVRLAQVFSNLLNNAAKYTDDHGRIEVSARRGATGVEISIQDSGIGIAADQMPKLFELFAQIDHSHKRAHGGLGIGLSLAKRLVQMHGGQIEATSAGLGQGSRFTVRLPIAEGIASHQQTPVAVEGPFGLRVLVIDDNIDAGESLGMLLRLLGAEVRIEHNGASALMVARAWRPAVVLLDLGMPEMDGFEVARRVRADNDLKGITLIALTGWGQQEDRFRTTAEGFDHHLVKPIDIDILQSLLASVENADDAPRTAQSRRG